MNLSLNACEAMLDGGTLMIGTSRKDNQVVIEVTDTGCGIKPEHLGTNLRAVFTTKPVGKGTGLGLSVSCGIVQQHGGSLEVEERAGQGNHLHDQPACGRKPRRLDPWARLRYSQVIRAGRRTRSLLRRTRGSHGTENPGDSR